MSELRIVYRRQSGLKPNRADRLAGMVEQTGVVSFELRVTSSDSRGPVSNHDRAQVFAAVLHALAAHRPSLLLFRYDLPEVRRKLSAAQVPVKEERGWIHVEIRAIDVEFLASILESVSFTTFYLCVDGNVPDSPVELFNTLQNAALVGTFSLFDETMEVVSPMATGDAILEELKRVAKARMMSLVAAT